MFNSPEITMNLHVCGTGYSLENAHTMLSELGKLILETYKEYLYNSATNEIDVENMASKINLTIKQKKRVPLPKQNLMNSTKLGKFISTNPMIFFYLF